MNLTTIAKHRTDANLNPFSHCPTTTVLLLTPPARLQKRKKAEDLEGDTAAGHTDIELLRPLKFFCFSSVTSIIEIPSIRIMVLSTIKSVKVKQNL